MTRPKITLLLLAGLVTLSLAAGRPAASGYSYGYDEDPDHFGWAIISDGNTSMSGMDDLDSLDRLKSKFGDEFLYLRVDEARYVVRDRALMKRAKDAARPLQEAGQEVGKAARAQAEDALAGSRDARAQAKLACKWPGPRSASRVWRVAGSRPRTWSGSRSGSSDSSRISPTIPTIPAMKGAAR